MLNFYKKPGLFDFTSAGQIFYTWVRTLCMDLMQDLKTSFPLERGPSKVSKSLSKLQALLQGKGSKMDAVHLVVPWKVKIYLSPECRKGSCLPWRSCNFNCCGHWCISLSFINKDSFYAKLRQHFVSMRERERERERGILAFVLRNLS